MIAVTGATGHLGNVVARELVSRGRAVRAVIPPGEDLLPLQDVPVEVCRADLRDPEALRATFRGCRWVFHLGGLVSISTGGRQTLFEVNVQGTRNVAQACVAQGVERLVYTSSVHAFPELPAGHCLTEAHPVDPTGVMGDYAASKAAATLFLREVAARGLDVVVVYPAGIVGPFDFKPSEMGQLLLEVARRRLWAYVEGSYNFVDVRDVAGAVVSAAERGRRGEGYILCGEVVGVKEYLELAAECCGVSPPRRKIPSGLARTVGMIAPLYYKVVGEKPLFTSYSIDVLRSNCLMSCDKARRELGFHNRPVAESLEDAVRWFRRAGRI